VKKVVELTQVEYFGFIEGYLIFSLRSMVCRKDSVLEGYFLVSRELRYFITKSLINFIVSLG
jgi:hypothetical protein